MASQHFALLSNCCRPIARLEQKWRRGWRTLWRKPPTQRQQRRTQQHAQPLPASFSGPDVGLAGGATLTKSLAVLRLFAARLHVQRGALARTMSLQAHHPLSRPVSMALPAAPVRCTCVCVLLFRALPLASAHVSGSTTLCCLQTSRLDAQQHMLSHLTTLNHDLPPSRPSNC